MQKKRVAIKYSKGIKYAGTDSKTLVSVLTGATSKKDVSNQLKKIQKIQDLNDCQKPDIISDLSLYNSQSHLYKEIIKSFPDFIVSTLPIYKCKDQSNKLTDQDLLAIIHQQIEEGVGFITIHPTPNKQLVDLAQKRIVPWTSRGGAMVIKDLVNRNYKQENIYLRIIDDIIEVAKANDVTVSLGASFRSANIFDSFDECQIKEFQEQKILADYISNKGVQVIIEGPGHSTPKKLNLIAKYYQDMGYPIMPLGPIPTDTAIGQDHISSSIGAVLLGMHNCVDIITSVTREEHTGGIPSIESSIEAILAAKVAAHIIDINKLEDFSEDELIVNYRAEFQTCIYGKKNSGCSRCAHVCPLKI